MRARYKLGDTVFFNYADTATASTKQSFGIVTCIQTIQGYTENDKQETTISYKVGEHPELVEEECVLGKALIQKPRTRRSRSKKAVQELKQMNGAAPIENQVQQG